MLVSLVLHRIRFTVDIVTKEQTLDMLHITAEVKGGSSGLKRTHVYLEEENDVITGVLGVR